MIPQRGDLRDRHNIEELGVDMGIILT
jgi:hypothetical protein